MPVPDKLTQTLDAMIEDIEAQHPTSDVSITRGRTGDQTTELEWSVFIYPPHDEDATTYSGSGPTIEEAYAKAMGTRK